MQIKVASTNSPANKYRVRQIAAQFVLEQLGHNGFEPCWLILDSVYSWEAAERMATEYGCEVF